MTTKINDKVLVRTGTFADIGKISDLYLELSPTVRRLFHPFPFQSQRLKVILGGMLIGQTMFRFLKYFLPRFGFIIVVAELSDHSYIEGFIYLRLIGKEHGKLIGSIGIVTREGSRTRGIGKEMYNLMINVSRRKGIDKLRSVVIEDNVVSLLQCQKLGYVILGYTKDDYWRGERLKSLTLEMDLAKDLF